MRWLRWTFVFAGFHFLFTALESPLESTAYAVITLLRWATGLIAIAFWHGWLIGVRGMTRVEGIVRKTHLGVAVDYALFCIAISLMPADATFVCPTVDPLVAPVLISVYLTGALSHIWLMTWRLHQRETIPVARAAFRALLIATTLVCVSIIAVHCCAIAESSAASGHRSDRTGRVWIALLWHCTDGVWRNELRGTPYRTNQRS
jgi:hypothetical protein